MGKLNKNDKKLLKFLNSKFKYGEVIFTPEFEPEDLNSYYISLDNLENNGYLIQKGDNVAQLTIDGVRYFENSRYEHWKFFLWKVAYPAFTFILGTLWTLMIQHLTSTK